VAGAALALAFDDFDFELPADGFGSADFFEG
jgi:hypothetical protein